MYTALTIAGSDTCGGAGIQADIKTMTALKVYGQCAITALTAQNTTGVKEIMEVSKEFLGSQLDAVFTDIYPDAVKCGMIPNASLIAMTAERLSFYQAKHIVVDPVMVSTSGHSLMETDALTTLKTKLLPLACVVTPNIPEAEVLSGMSIHSKTDVEKAAQKIFEETGSAILLKGGHGILDASDFLFTANGSRWFLGQRIDNPNTHGTGCTLSSAIASYLAMGMDLEGAVQKAKDYLTGAIAAGLNLGKGSGPLNHTYQL
jgi:hydroxymethylpyrimidine/phosphomethylpyrimidine kinase